MTPRAYQTEAIDAIEEGWSAAERQLLVLPTGAGKSLTFSLLAARQPGQTLILVHREELLLQAVAKLHRATGIHAAVERGAETAMPGHRVTVASVQSLKRRLARYSPDAFDLIICDEAHHVLAIEWRTVLNHFTGCQRILGVTATPDRTDQRSLGTFFQRIAFEVGLLDLIRQGYLCKLRAKQLNVRIDVAALSGRKTITDDEAAAAISPWLRQLASEVAANARDRKALIFLPRCDLSQRFADLLTAEDIQARHVAGISDDRRETLDWFAEPGPKMLCNAMLLTEGYDQPDVDCIVCLRLTRSRALYSQIVGRGTRIFPGKEHLLLLDPLWLTGKHDLCMPADLTGGNKTHRQVLQDKLVLGMDLLEAEEAARDSVEERLARQLRKEANKAPKGMIDPLAFALSIHDTALAEYEPVMDWEFLPATDAQINTLEKSRLWTKGMSRGQATMLLTRLAARSRLGLATPAQVRLLRRMRDPNADVHTMAQAGHALEQRFTYARRGR